MNAPEKEQKHLRLLTMTLCNIISAVESDIQPDMQYKGLIVYVCVYTLCVCFCVWGPFVWAEQEEVNVLTDNLSL